MAGVLEQQAPALRIQVFAVLKQTLDKLALVGAITVDPKVQAQELTQSVGEEITRELLLAPQLCRFPLTSSLLHIAYQLLWAGGKGWEWPGNSFGRVGKLLAVGPCGTHPSATTLSMPGLESCTLTLARAARRPPCRHDCTAEALRKAV